MHSLTLNSYLYGSSLTDWQKLCPPTNKPKNTTIVGTVNWVIT